MVITYSQSKVNKKCLNASWSEGLGMRQQNTINFWRNDVMCFEQFCWDIICAVVQQLGKMNVASGGVAENKGPNEIDSANSKRSSSWISTGERQKDGLEPPFFALVSYQHPALSQRRPSATKRQIPCTSGPVSVIKQYSKILATFKKIYNAISKLGGAVFKNFCYIQKNLQHNQ